MAAVLLPIGLGVLLVSCSSPDTQSGQSPAQPPTSQGGTTDPAFDWERPPDPKAVASQQWHQTLTFQSSKTFEQTSRWLQWAMERYGHVRHTLAKTDVSDVRSRRCTMEWNERQLMDGVTRESKYSIQLADVNLRLTTVQVSASSDQVSFSLTKDTEIVRRYLEHGREKGTRSEREGIINIYVRNEDQIPHRVSWALIHISRLCGAEAKTGF